VIDGGIVEGGYTSRVGPAKRVDCSVFGLRHGPASRNTCMESGRID